MSVNIEKLLEDAKLLVSRLLDKDRAVDELLSNAGHLGQTIGSMKEILRRQKEELKVKQFCQEGWQRNFAPKVRQQKAKKLAKKIKNMPRYFADKYDENVAQMHAMRQHRPRSGMILGLVQENRQLRQLQSENADLLKCVEEQQSVMDLIMKKYREQMFSLMRSNNLDTSLVQARHAAYEEKIRLQSEQLQNALAVMHKAVLDLTLDPGEDTINEVVTSLQEENKGLREMLMISQKTGDSALVKPRRVECFTQTDPPPPAFPTQSADTASLQQGASRGCDNTQSAGGVVACSDTAEALGPLSVSPSSSLGDSADCGGESGSGFSPAARQCFFDSDCSQETVLDANEEEKTGPFTKEELQTHDKGKEGTSIGTDSGPGTATNQDPPVSSEGNA